jgi:hypothetical protein
MNIVIYNTNSFGGNYEYSKQIAAAYIENKEVNSCEVIVPQNSNGDTQPYLKKKLLPDIPRTSNKLLKKIYFLYRSLVNPFKFYSYLKSLPRSVIIFNDFDQYTSVFWAPFFRGLRSKHIFSVILHDPDRDNYFPAKSLSEFSMAQVMSVIHIAFYHELLPDKPYYQNSKALKVKVPHGIYTHAGYNQKFYDELISKKGGDKLISILGNIRDEKNYEMVIKCLPQIQHTKLLVAGKASSSNVPIAHYKKLITDTGVSDRVLWEERFMTDDEFQSAIKASDVVLLYYKDTFTSQSGVLNLIAPHKKYVIVSDVPSALRETVNKFFIGKVVKLEDSAFAQSLNELINTVDLKVVDGAWNKYLEYASWHNHVAIAVGTFKEAEAKLLRS